MNLFLFSDMTCRTKFNSVFNTEAIIGISDSYCLKKPREQTLAVIND